MIPQPVCSPTLIPSVHKEVDSTEFKVDFQRMKVQA